MQIEWLPQDADFTREFLNSETGQKLLSMLQHSTKVEDGKSLEEEALNFRFAKGATYMLNALVRSADKQTQQFGEAIPFESPLEDHGTS